MRWALMDREETILPEFDLDIQPNFEQQLNILGRDKRFWFGIMDFIHF